MQLIDIMPNKVGKITDKEGDILRVTRAVNVVAFMLDHLKKDEAAQFEETVELIYDLGDTLTNLANLSAMLSSFANYCIEHGSGEVVTLAEKLLSVTSALAPLDGVSFDYDSAIENFSNIEIADIRHGETSKLYQRRLNLSNVYTLIVRLANTLSERMLCELPEGSIGYELAGVIFQMTEEVRYG